MNPMRLNYSVLLLVCILNLVTGCTDDDDMVTLSVDRNFDITTTEATHHPELAQIEMTMTVAGNADATTPIPVGSVDGAPVLGYVFPTTLASSDVGFGDVEGIVAIALTSHPDFDDTVAVIGMVVIPVQQTRKVR